MQFNRTIPTFRIFDEVLARDFYIDFLGFVLDWEHRFEPGLPLFMSVSKGDCQLYLSGHFGDACPGSAVTIDMKGVDEYQQQLVDKKYKHARPGVCDTEFGTRQMTITDPFGNQLTFSEEREK